MIVCGNALQNLSAERQELFDALKEDVAAINALQIFLHQLPRCLVTWCKRRRYSGRWLRQQRCVCTAPSPYKPEEQRLTAQKCQSDPLEPMMFVEPQCPGHAKYQQRQTHAGTEHPQPPALYRWRAAGSVQIAAGRRR